MIVYPGTFDPITKGHMELIARAAAQFQEVVVLVMENPAKNCLFTVEERIEMIDHAISGFPNVRVTSGSGLAVQAVQQLGATMMLRGLRSAADFALEETLARNNAHLAPQVETIWMLANAETAFISSSAVKEVLHCGGKIDGYVDAHVKAKLLEKNAHQRI